MTIDDFIEYTKLTPDNAEEKIKEFKRTWWGSCGGNTDFQCNPKGVKLNAILKHNHPERNLEEITISWKELRNYISQPKQLTLW